MQTFKPGDSLYYFVVERAIDAGHDGTVYEIVHRQTGDRFALKTMWAADCVDPSKIARALAAAKGNYRIDHRRVVKVFDLNCEANGMVWMRVREPDRVDAWKAQAGRAGDGRKRRRRSRR